MRQLFACRRFLFLQSTALQILLCLFAGIPMAAAQMPGQKMPGLSPVEVRETSHGMLATAGKETLDVTVCAESVIYVVARPEQPTSGAPQRPWMLEPQQSCGGAPFTVAQDAQSASLKTAKLEVTVSLERGNLSFRTVEGESLLNEGSSIPRTYEPVELNGDHTFRVTDRFSPSSAEALFGLGQHQNGMFNYRGATIELAQDNTDVAIPLLVSSKGYALMWNTAALTYVDNRFPLELTLSSIAGQSIDYCFL
jgi:alpha-D-xyloside xylohydrolase